MPKPQAFSTAQLDELRMRFAERGSLLADLLDRQSRIAFANGELHDHEELEAAIDAVVAFADDVAFLAERGRVPSDLDAPLAIPPETA